MEGFGASDAWRCQMVGKFWPEEKRNQIAEWLFSQEVDEFGNPKGIGLSLWRFYLGSGSAEQGLDSNIADEWRRAECFQSPDGSYDWSKQEGQRWFLNAAKSRGVEKFLAFSLCPPVQMSANGKAFASKAKKMNIKEGMMPDYADFLVECIDNLQKNEGITFNYLSPVNEPQWDWNTPGQEGTPVTNDEISQFVKLLSSKLSQRNLQTTVALGEAASIQYLYEDHNSENFDNQIDEFWNPSSPLSVASLPNVEHLISGHSYWTVYPYSSLVDCRQELAEKLAQYPGLKYWQTEYSILEAPGESEIPNGNGNKRDLGMSTALFVARIIHNDLVTANTSCWSWWTALTRADYKDGLIYLDDGTNNGAMTPADYCKYDGYARDSKLMWAYGNYSFFIRPGMKRVEVITENPDPVSEATDVMISAFKDEASKKIFIVVVNTGNITRTYNLDGLNIKDQKLIPYTTSEASNLARGNEVNISEIPVQARSITTFVGELQ